MRIKEYVEIVERAMRHNKQLLVVGPAGIGKTQVPEDFFRDSGWEWGSACMPMLDPTFFMGYPFRNGDTASHLPFGLLHRALNATGPFGIVLDEFGSASESTLKACLRFMQFREVCGRRLPDCVRIIALSNDVSHGAGISGIIEPMKGRFDTIINVEPHIDDTVAYAYSRNWPAWLIAFLKNNPGSLCDYVPVKSMKVGGSDPRAWEKVAELDRDGFLDTPVASELICGRVGPGHGSKALAFRELANKLPDIDTILLDPAGSIVPKEPDVQYYVATAVASKLSGKTFGACVRYLNRLPQIMRAYSLQSAVQRENEWREKDKMPKDYVSIHMSPDFSVWCTTSDAKEIKFAGA